MVKRNPKSLEKIATLLIKGKLSREEAAFLSKELSVSHKKKVSKPLKVVEGIEGFNVVDSKGEIKAYANFYVDQDSFRENFLRITSLESYERFNGDASLLLESLSSFALKKGLNYILAEVDKTNDEAINVFSRGGFYSVGRIETCGLNLEREIVRKDIFI